MADIDTNVDLSIPMQPDMEVIATTVAESIGTFMGLDENKVDEAIMRMHDQAQWEMYNDRDMNWSGLR